MDVRMLMLGAGVATAIAALGTISLLSKQEKTTPFGTMPPPVTDTKVDRPGPVQVAFAPLKDALVVPLKGAMGTDSVLTSGGDISFCFPDVIDVEGGCLTKRELLAFDDRPKDLLSPDGETRYSRVMMVHPTDFSVPEKVVNTCTVFASLKTEGWGPMTTADMADEGKFLRYCGLLSLARLAEEPRTSRFGTEGLTETELSKVAPDAWPALGEPFKETPVITQDKNDPRLWYLDAETLITRMRDVAHADFDGDGEGERLIFLAARARGGTAGFSGYGILEKSEEDVRLRPIRWE